MNKIPNNALNLKQFLLRAEVIKLYREIFKTIREVPDPKSQVELREWARTDFKNNKHHTDEIVIKMMMQHAQKALKELRTSINIAK